jgi:hypothetical protein
MGSQLMAETQQSREASFLEAVRRLDAALTLLNDEERGHATVVRISEIRAVLTGRRVTAGRA